MLNKNTSLKIFFIVFLSFLLIISLVFSSCSLTNQNDEKLLATLNDYENKILILENELMHLKNDHDESNAKKDAEIKDLKNEITELKESLKSTESTPPSGDEPDKKSDFTYKIENGGATITGYTGKSTTVIIPGAIDGHPVKSIGDEAFKGSKITSASIPSTVTSIGWFAFADCSSLSALVVPESVTSIGYEAFSGSKSLTVYASTDSYAAKYAKSYGITVSLE